MRDEQQHVAFGVDNFPGNAAISWAQDQFATKTVESVANHTWAKTYRLRGQSLDAYLKLLAKSDPRRNQAVVEIARSFAPQVPAIVAAETDRGFFVFNSHEGSDFDHGLDDDVRRDLLSLYGELQGKTVSKPAITSQLPKTTCVRQLDVFLNLLRQAADEAPDPGMTGNPFLYMRPSSVGRYYRIFKAAEPVLRAFLSKGDSLAPTLNHCDLRAKNIAQRKDGSLCIFDWDDAVCGPPGLSLHAQFSGCTRVLSAMRHAKSASDGDLRALHAYAAALAEHGGYSPEDLVSALPATAAAGVMRYCEGFAPYHTTSERSQKSIARSVKRRISDLMDLVVMLADQYPDDCANVIDAFKENRRGARADAITASLMPQKMTSARFRELVAESDPPEVFPAVQISSAEQRVGKMSSDTRDLAVELFQRHGGVMIKDAFDPRQLEDMRREFNAMSNEHDEVIKGGGARRVGNQRYMISLALEGAFANPNVIAPPFVLPVVHRLLTRHAILGSFTAVASYPGAKDQSLHRDNPPLFEEHSGMETPSFCIALIVPLIPLDEKTGATRIMKGSHRMRSQEIDGLPFQNPTVDLGSCYLMDSRLFHQGMANNSDRVRPILSLVYQRPWYRDHKNFKQQTPLIMSGQQLDDFPEDMRRLVAWAG